MEVFGLAIPPELVQLVLNLLNYAMFVGGGLLKLPQVIAILRKRTVKGISETSLATEFLACISFCSYNLLMGHPLKTWGEMALIAVQCGILTIMFWFYSEEPPAIVARISGTVGTVVFVGLVLQGKFPKETLPVLGIVPTLLGAAARVPQIVMNWRQGHTGALSIIPWTMAMAGNSVRIITTLAAIDDIITLAGPVVAFVLNGTLVVQIFYYKEVTNEVFQNQMKEDKKTN